MVKIEIINCGNEGSDEEICAKELEAKLKAQFQKTSASGNIYILTNVLLYGFYNNEIDIIVLGELDNFKTEMYCKSKTVNEYDVDEKKLEVDIKDFCFTIELKKHAPSFVTTDPIAGIIVQYKDSKYEEKVSNQSNNQKNGLLKTLLKQFSGHAPRIINMIWLRNVNNASEINNTTCPNVLYGDFPIKKFWETSTTVSKNFMPILDVNNPNQATLSASGSKMDSIKKIIEKISKQPVFKGQITRQKIERITDDKINITLNDLSYEKGLLVFRGKAGTGKTSALLRIAYLLKEEKNARCLILSYNRALVGDMFRTFAFFPREKRPDGKMIQVSTMQKFFNSIMPAFNIPVPQFGKNYKKEYDQAMSQLNQKLADEDDVKLLRMEKPELYWDYILVDEAQDWTDDEKEVIMKLYADGHLIIADGVDQIVRNGTAPQNWLYGLKKDDFDRKDYKIGLRQTSNLIEFVNSYSAINNMEWTVNMPSDGNLGGVIKVYSTENFMNNFENLMVGIKNSLTASNNEPYDLLMLTTRMFVEKNKINEDIFSKKYSSILKQIKLPIFDGVNSNEREDYPIDQMRVYRYESCRGLEGWTAICLDFDGFLAQKANDYIDVPDMGAVNSLEERKKEYVNYWALMPLTRPINELIITVTDLNSTLAQQLRTLKQQHKDSIQLYI